MALFGRKRPMYQGMDPEYTARNIPIGQAPVSGTIPMGQMEQPQQPRQKPHWLGVVGDSLSILGGGQAQYVPNFFNQQAQQRDAQAKSAAMLEGRAYDQGEWTRRQEYERANAKPVNNDTVNDLNWYKTLSDDDRKLYHQIKPTISYRGDGTPVAINPYDLQQGGQRQGPQVGQVEDGHRFKGGDPANPTSWEKIGGSAPQAQGGFPVNYNQFKRAIIQQETGGRYGVANAEGSGALGLGQIMPDTAKALSRKLGLPYRPDLLSGDRKQARDYQDVLTDAAVKEAWQYGGAGKDPQTSAQYYFAGPNKKGWGPKTRHYGQQVLGRIK